MFYVGLDIGYGQTKLSWSKDFGESRVEVLPSGAAPIEQCDGMRLNAAGEASLVYGETVYVRGTCYGALIDPERISSGMQTLHADYPSTPQYMALYLGALARLDAIEVDQLVTGLPVSQTKNRDRAVRIKAMLEGVHEIRPGQKVHVKKVTIVPQATGAYCAYLDRQPQGLSLQDTVLVVDCGHYSLNWVQVSGDSYRHEASSSSTRGGSMVIDRMVKLIEKKYRTRVSRETVYRYVRSGLMTVQLGRDLIDLKTLREDAARVVAPQAMGEILTSRRGQANDINRVLVCGGGVPFYLDAVTEAFPRAGVDEVPNAVLANAIGFRLFAKVLNARS